MDSFGEYLKRERELRGVTLEEIAKASNISKTYLNSLENDDFENLPAEVFIKGFIRCYAENTGMDGSEAVLAYNSFIANKRISQPASEISTETPIGSNVKVPFFMTIVILIVASSLMVFYYVKKNSEIKPSFASEEKISQRVDEIVVEESKSNADIVPDSDIIEEKDLIEPEEIQPQPQNEGISDNLNLPPPTDKEEVTETKKVMDSLTLSVEATENAWLSLAIDDAEIKEALLKAGETATWKAKEKFVVTLGNVTGTHLKLNDKDIILPNASSNVIKDFSITLDNIN